MISTLYEFKYSAIVFALMCIIIGTNILLVFSYFILSINPNIKAKNILDGDMCIIEKIMVVISIDFRIELNSFNLL